MTLLLQLLPLADAPAHVAWLGGDERARLARITDAGRAAQYVAGHCLARQLGAEQAGGEAREWRLQVTDDGRRRLEHDRHAPLYASLSHVHGWVAAAVGAEAMGVDLEASGRPRDWLALARTMFSPDEVESVLAAPDAGRESAFLRLWTLKEAWAKRSGQGLQRQAARRCTALACDPADAEAWTWRLADGGWLALAASPGCAVAARGVRTNPGPWRYLPVPA